MPERNSNLLVDPAEAPVAGIQYDHIVAWYGGPVQVTVSGETSGAADLMVCTRIPTLTGAQTYADVLTDADWVKLHTFADNSVFSAPNLNPCMLAMKFAAPGVVGTRAVVS